ncbi:hypothetical protein M514_13236 [Trichuris suis]|uniref:Uncharacterized protein n=1 Tax=Trichuris suis TaxID=68888 RepID=A0A085MSB5_9BILA|nr:hypothetical protein M513_13236 [Trichuris suis]KFD60111.1 hypothetical protein M514_13236 [Trichuris suis]
MATKGGYWYARKKILDVIANQNVTRGNLEESNLFDEILTISYSGFSFSYDRLNNALKDLTRYNKAKQELEGTNTETAHRGRPPSLPPLVAMERALAASAVAEHAAHWSGSLQTRIICKEPQFSIRRIKEALYIQHNTTINRDNGVEKHGKVSNADRKEKKKKEERREKTNRGATTDTTDEKPRCHYGRFGRKIKTAKHHEKSRKK